MVLASSDYGLRKPHPLLFQAALRKSGLSGDEVWFCGDSILRDVEGAAGAGIFPVWYQNPDFENPHRNQEADLTPTCEHLQLSEWDELLPILDSLPA